MEHTKRNTKEEAGLENSDCSTTEQMNDVLESKQPIGIYVFAVCIIILHTYTCNWSTELVPSPIHLFLKFPVDNKKSVKSESFWKDFVDNPQQWIDCRISKKNGFVLFFLLLFSLSFLFSDDITLKHYNTIWI